MKLLSPSLQAFLVTARAGSVHAAARELHLTQTGVTRRIAALEADLGVTLFLRSRRGMRLNEAGQALLTYCKQAVDLEGEALSAVLGGREAEPQLVLQGPSSLMRVRAIPAICAALEKFPGAAIDFRIDDVGGGLEALKQGHADLAIVPRADVVAEVDSKRLRPERYLLVGPPHWAGRALQDIVAQERIVDFNPRDQATYQVLAVHGLRDQARPTRHFVNNTDALASLVEAGLGYSALAEEFAAPGLAAGRLIRLGGRAHYDLELALIWYPRKHMAAHFKAVIAAIK